MKITVTQDDIDKGERLNSNECPIARAITTATNAHFVSVCRDEIIILGATYRIGQPEINFIDAFDRGEAVAPFEFELID